MIAALVPMKYNSERVPGKNLKLINNHPLFFFIMDTLFKSKNISNVYLDTDSNIIAEEVLKFFPKTKVIMRPEELHGDHVSMNKIINYDLTKIEEENILQTHVTNPLLTTKTIDKACEMFLTKNSHDSVFSTTEIQNRFYDKNIRPINHDPKKLIRTQDLDPLFLENSNFYIFSKDSFKNANARIGLKPQMYAMDSYESLDIDNPKDFEIAKILLESKK